MASQYLLMYNVMILIYCSVVVLYFFDFMHSNKKLNKIAFALLSVVWIIQTVLFHMRMKELDYIPITSLFETLFFYSWMLVTLTLVINYLYKVDLMVFLANAVGFGIVILNLFVSRQTEPNVNELLQGGLLTFHVTFVILSYGLFFLSCLLSLLYLIQIKLLKSKKISSRLFRKMPPLDKIDKLAYILALIAYPILLVSLILGSIWAYMHGIVIWTDVKFVISVLVLVIYGVYLQKKVMMGWQGSKLAVLNICGFSFIVLNYLLSKWVSSFHYWV